MIITLQRIPHAVPTSESRTCRNWCMPAIPAKAQANEMTPLHLSSDGNVAINQYSDFQTCSGSLHAMSAFPQQLAPMLQACFIQYYRDAQARQVLFSSFLGYGAMESLEHTAKAIIGPI